MSSSTAMRCLGSVSQTKSSVHPASNMPRAPPAAASSRLSVSSSRESDRLAPFARRIAIPLRRDDARQQEVGDVEQPTTGSSPRRPAAARRRAGTRSVSAETVRSSFPRPSIRSAHRSERDPATAPQSPQLRAFTCPTEPSSRDGRRSAIRTRPILPARHAGADRRKLPIGTQSGGVRGRSVKLRGAIPRMVAVTRLMRSARYHTGVAAQAFHPELVVEDDPRRSRFFSMSRPRRIAHARAARQAWRSSRPRPRARPHGDVAEPMSTPIGCQAATVPAWRRPALREGRERHALADLDEASAAERHGLTAGRWR